MTGLTLRRQWTSGSFSLRTPFCGPIATTAVSVFWVPSFAAPCAPRRRSVSHRLLQRGDVDRQLSQALAGCRKDRVGHCGNDGRSPGLAHSARRLEAPDDVDLDGRSLIHAQDLVRVEIGLLDASLLQRDLAME